MKHFKPLLISVVLLVSSSHALAWGDREQGILQGLAGAWIIGRMLQNNEVQSQPPIVVQPQPPVYVYPYQPPRGYYYQPRCYSVPFYDHWGRLSYYKQVCN